MLEKCWGSAQTGQKRKHQSEFGVCSLEQTEMCNLEWRWLCPLGHTSPAPLCGLHHPGQAEVSSSLGYDFWN